MDPDHDGLAPGCPPEPQCLAPEFALVAAYALDFSALLLLSTFDVLELTRNPLVFTGLVDKLQAVFLERRDGIQRKLVIRGDKRRRPGYHHGRHGFVRLEELFNLLSWDGNKMCLEVF